MLTNQEFDKWIKNRLECYQPVYQKAEWLNLLERLTEYDKIHSKQPDGLLNNVSKHLN